jgi:ATP-dependent Lon protease
MKTIQEELGGVSRGRNGGDACKIKTKKWDEKTQKFRKRIVKMPYESQAPDFGIQRNYLELLLELPWNEYSKDNFDLKEHKR